MTSEGKGPVLGCTATTHGLAESLRASAIEEVTSKVEHSELTSPEKTSGLGDTTSITGVLPEEENSLMNKNRLSSRSLCVGSRDDL